MKNPKTRRELERLVLELLPRLHRTAYYLTRREQRADDAVQETIARFLRTLASDATRIRQPAAWCLQVLRRICFERSTQPLELHDGSALVIQDPADELSAEETRVTIRSELAELPDREREALCLHVFGELTVREVAKSVGVSKSVAHERIRSGLARLRTRLRGTALGAGALGCGVEDLTAALRSLPFPRVPESLVSRVLQLTPTSASGVAGASLTAASVTSGAALMTGSKIALIATGAVLIATSLGVGFRFGREGSERTALDEGSSAAAGLASRDAARTARLELENARLSRRIDSLEAALVAAREEAASPTKEATTTASSTRTSAEVEGMLEAALAAFEAKDVGAFQAQLLALLDSGSVAHPALVQLLRTTGSYNQMIFAMGVDSASNRVLIPEVTARRRELGGLVDFILSRDEDPDGATLFAFDLLRYNEVESDLSFDAHASALASVLQRAIETESDHVEWNDHAIAAAGLLGEMRMSESLPALETLLDDAATSEANRVALIRAVAQIGGDDAVAILAKVRDGAPPPLRRHLMRNLAMYDYLNPEVDQFLRDSLALEDDAGTRAEIALRLSKREGAGDDIIERVQRGDLDERERVQLITRLIESNDARHRDAAWSSFERIDADGQDEILPVLANRDQRAMDLLLDRLRSGRIGEELAHGVGRLRARLVEKHREEFLRAAGDVNLPAPNRAAAASALGKLDRDVAARELTIGFDASPESARLEIVRALRHQIGGDFAREMLDRVAANDPSARVRAAVSE